jgi:hypothetical protein
MLLQIQKNLIKAVGVFFFLFFFLRPSYGGLSSVYFIRGVITKIENNLVTIKTQEEEVTVRSVWVPQEKRIVGALVLFLAEDESEMIK